MPRPFRGSVLAIVAWGLAGLAACAPKSDVRSCATADECPAGSRCISSTCVANAPPSVEIAVPASPEANALLSFDASASTDRDPGDAIASFAWSFRAVSADACTPPVVAGTGAVANVRFGCRGRYAVDVTATDQMGARSTGTREFDVAAYGGPSLLTVGDDVPLDHVCTTPTSCSAGPTTLSASTTGIDQVSFSWTVEAPPDRPLSSSRRVTFSPSQDVASPTVALETDGDAISGDWIFHVEARDAAGSIGTAAVRVSVLNRAPIVAATVPVPEHAFDGAQFVVDGEVPFTVSDPDGDPLVDRTVDARHSGDGTSVFAATFVSGPAVSFSIRVPYLAPEDAAHLIGGAGLERTLVFGISDVNGARTTKDWAIVVGNRPPVLATQPATFTIGHGFDATALSYVADVPLSTWSDPDGDPLSQVGGSSTSDPICPDVTVVNGVARAHCRLAFTGVPSVGNFAGTHTVSQAIQDPWAPATTTSAVSFEILNRAPTIAATAIAVRGLCHYSATCCLRDPETNQCLTEWATVSGTASVPAAWSDPDGDPVSVTVTPTGSYTPLQNPLVCTSADCALDVDVAPITVCTSDVATNLPTTVSDGMASAAGALPLQATCYTPQ